MHNHTPERVKFLEEVGFKRVILARELSLEQIKAIRAQTNIELESFIHGALCVSYSGQCTLSYAIGGRSGNRGQCAQPCRNIYSLVDGNGKILENNRHLLSIHDLNLTGHLESLINAGVTSFKIEGRLKDKNYVMNVVGHYRKVLDGLQVKRSSSGLSYFDFEPDLEKTFNRGYCEYFIEGRKTKIGSPATPKMVGEALGKVKMVTPPSFSLDDDAQTSEIHNGDGLSFFSEKGQLSGTLVNRVEGRRIFPARLNGIRSGMKIYRNYDKAFMDRLKAGNTTRKIKVEMHLFGISNGCRLVIHDEDGNVASTDKIYDLQAAEKPEQARQTILKQLGKLGDTEFVCEQVNVETQPVPFLPASAWNELRREAVENLRKVHNDNRPRLMGGVAPNSFPHPAKELDFHGNVLNEKAAAFYRRHGVVKIEPAAESGLDMSGRQVMTTRYCLKYELDACPRHGGKRQLQEPLALVDEEGHTLRLAFDCAKCEMGVFYEGKT